MSNKLQIIEEKNITDLVLNRINEKRNQGSLQLPSNYSPQNALTSAFLILQEAQTKNKESVLKVCSKTSIANSLMSMVVQGLNPDKGQCYFIPYGNKLTFQRSYLGSIAMTKRLDGVTDVKGYPVYKEDKFKLGFDVMTGKQTLEEFSPGTERKANNLIGAFAVVIGEKELLHVEYMTIDQIKQAWNQGQMKGESPAHKNFPDQMAIKTVINRACKFYVNTSDDSGLIAGVMMDQTDSEVEIDIEENANQELLADVTPEPEYEEIDEETGEVFTKIEDIEVEPGVPF